MSADLELILGGFRGTVVGLGNRAGGAGVASYLAGHGIEVTVTDLRDEESLKDSLETLTGLPIRFVLGRHDEADFTRENADFVVRNPAVPRHAPLLETARREGLPVHMELELFLRLSPAPVIGITGTKGKTSTSYLTEQILRQTDPRTILVGNMGLPALPVLDEIEPEIPVVAEISNWQLEGMAEHQVGPAIAVLTNISEDHLNTYASFGEYASVKQSIAGWLGAEDWLVTNADDPLCRIAAETTGGQIAWFGEQPQQGFGSRFDNQALHLNLPGLQATIDWPESSALHFEVQRRNAAAAATAAALRGASAENIATGLRTFRGVPHRLEEIATIDGVTFVNDTAATAPVAAVASMQAYQSRPIHLIAGGADKQLDLTPLVEAIRRYPESTVLLAGAATDKLSAALPGILVVGSMTEALDYACAHAQPGSVVLLSPGCASFGIFRDEFDRGDQFRELVLAKAREDG